MALPGVTTVLQDKFSSLTRTSVAAGPSIVIIGNRDTPDNTNGVPDLEPYLFSKESDVVASYGYGSQLHRGYLECLAGGGVSISLLALPVGTTDADLLVTSAGNVFDAAFDASAVASPRIIVPWGRGGHPSEWTAAGATPDYPSGGSVPQFGFTANNSANTSSSLAVRVANKMAQLTLEGTPVFAVMGLKPVVAGATETVPAATLNTYLTLPTMVSRDDASFNGTGPYLSIVATEIRPLTYPKDDPAGYPIQTGSSFGYSNGAAMYAGFISTLAAYNAPTGKTPFNITSVRWIPTVPQQAIISTEGMVPLALNYLRQPTWVDGPTYASTGSDYSRLTTLRIVFDAVQLLRNASVPFVGQGSTLANRTAFDTAVSSALRSMALSGAVTASDYNINYHPATNSAEVDLVLTPAFEIRSITISVSINLA